MDTSLSIESLSPASPEARVISSSERAKDEPQEFSSQRAFYGLLEDHTLAPRRSDELFAPGSDSDPT